GGITPATGIELDSSSANNTFINSSGIGGDFGISVGTGASGNTFTNITSYGTNDGFRLSAANNNTITNSTLLGVDALYIFTASDNQVINSSIAGSTNDISMPSGGATPSLNNSIINSTLDLWDNTITAADGSYIPVWWYGQLRALDYVDAAIEGAFFNVSNNTAEFLYANLTDATGYSNWTLIEGQILTSAGVFQLGNHTFNASKAAYNINWTNATINQSRTVTVYLKLTPTTDLSFTLQYPPTGCTGGQGNTSGACGAAGTCVCDQVYITTNESATYTPIAGLANQNCTSPQGQTSVFAFLNFTNTGNVPFNWTVATALPSTLALIFNQTEDVGPLCTATTMNIPVAPSYAVVNDSVQVGVSAYAWLYGNFTDAPIGTVESDINSTSCQAIGGC
ncbi:MAG: hypothetical protein WC759_04830, partial [Candidatus Micrarchaeia archaeon]